MGRFFVAQLMERFVSHGRIALHDPERIGFVARPCRILYEDPAVLFSLACCKTYSIIIIEVCNGSVSTELLDVGETLRRSSLMGLFSL